MFWIKKKNFVHIIIDSFHHTDVAIHADESSFFVLYYLAPFSTITELYLQWSWKNPMCMFELQLKRPQNIFIQRLDKNLRGLEFELRNSPLFEMNVTQVTISSGTSKEQ